MSLRMAAQCPSGLSTVVLFVLNLVSMHETCYCNQECALGHAVLSLPPVLVPALVLRHDGLGHGTGAAHLGAARLSPAGCRLTQPLMACEAKKDAWTLSRPKVAMNERKA